MTPRKVNSSSGCDGRTYTRKGLGLTVLLQKQSVDLDLTTLLVKQGDKWVWTVLLHKQRKELDFCCPPAQAEEEDGPDCTPGRACSG
jgi:hypothetical protein